MSQSLLYRRARTWTTGIAVGALLASGVTIAVAPAAPAAPLPTELLTYEGRVVESGTNYGIANAVVVAGGRYGCCYAQTRADSAGNFTIQFGSDFEDDSTVQFVAFPPLSGDDTTNRLGATYFRSVAGDDTIGYFAGDDTNLGLFGLQNANLIGQVTKTGGGGSIVQDDSVNLTARFYTDDQFNSNGPGWRLPVYSDGSFRSYFPPSLAPNGLELQAEPNPWQAPGFAAGYAPAVVRTSINAAITNSITLNPVNFYAVVKNAAGVTAPEWTWVEASVGDGPGRIQIPGRSTDSSGHVGLYIPANLRGDDTPVRFNLGFNDDNGGQKQRTYTLSATDGNNPNARFVLQPLVDNFRITVLAGGQPADAYVNVRTMAYQQIANGNTDADTGEMFFYTENPTSEMNVYIDPRGATASAGFGAMSLNIQDTNGPSGGLYEATVNLLQDNLEISVTAAGQPVGNAPVCLNAENYAFWIGCESTTSAGKAYFAVQDPGARFELQVTPPSALTAAGYAGFSGQVQPSVSGGQGSYTAALQLANVNLTVRNQANELVSDANIWLQPMGWNQGYNATTDSSGVARLYIAPNFLDGMFHINVQPPWGLQGTYSNRQYNEEELLCPGGDAPCTFEAVLQQANALFKVVAPGTNSPMAWANLEFRIPDDWMSNMWANSDQSGLAAATLEDDTYELFVMAPWNTSDDTIYASAKYIVTVTNGTVSSVTRNGQAAIQSGGRWSVSPALALYTTTVMDPTDDSMANSWVEVLTTTEGGWQEYVTGSSTNADGRVGFTLDDGTYILRARVPWGQTGLAPSVDCTLVVQGGAVAAGTTCGSILRLREPNLRVRMVAPNGDGLANAWACVGRENDWNWSCEGSNFSGYVSFMIDDTQASNTLGDLIVEGNPPWNSDDYAPARNTIEDDSFIGVAVLDDTVTFKTPNVRVQVALDDDTEAARWSWVNIVRIVDDNTWQWVGGSSANSAGLSQFSVDDTSGTFCVEAYPPWEQRENFGSKSVCSSGVLNTGAVTINIKTANVVTQVVDSDGRRNQFGWAEIQPVTPSGTRTGTGLDDRGRFAAALDPGTYDVTFYPGWQRSGSPTTIRVVVTANGSDIPSTVQLGAGNVEGTVTSGSEPYAGVVVVAEQGAQRIAAVTDDAGNFRLELGSGTWTISAIPPPGGASPTVNVLAGGNWNSPQLVVP